MTDAFQHHKSGLESPGYDAQAVTPDDAADLPIASRALYVGTEGDVRLTMAGGNAITFRAVQPGFLPLRVTRVHATGTTATDIVAVW